MSPAALGKLLLRKGSPPIAEGWVQGPTFDDKSVTVSLATQPLATGFDGLCMLESAHIALDWENETTALDIGGPREARRRFVLTDDMATLKQKASDASCDDVKPLTRGTTAPPILTIFERDGRNFMEASAATARFAVATMMQSRTAAERLRVTVERCAHGFTDVPSSCGDPAAFARTYYLRQIAGLVVDRCPNDRTICVDATITDLRGCNVDHVVVDTGLRSIPKDPNASIPIVTIVVRAGSDPID